MYIYNIAEQQPVSCCCAAANNDDSAPVFVRLLLHQLLAPSDRYNLNDCWLDDVVVV